MRERGLLNQESKELRGHKDKVHTIGWSADGRKLASGSIDQTVKIWSLDRSSPIADLRGHAGDVDQLLWDPSHPEKLCTASLDKTLKFWDVRVPRLAVHTIVTPGENINLAWSHDARHLVVGNKEDTLLFLDLRGGKSPSVFKTLKMNVEINEMGWNLAGDLFFLTTGKGI